MKSNKTLFVPGLRKKRSAPPPPVTRPLSSAISTQALEQIIDSEESLTSDIDPSKPPSDIGAPSKASSDIEDRPKASSDIGVTTASAALPSKIDYAKSDSAKSETCAKSDLEPRHRSGPVNVKSPGTVPSRPAPVEAAPVDGRVARQRGKLVRSHGSMENNRPSYSFVSRHSFEHVEEGTGSVGKYRGLFDPERAKLQSKIDCYRAERGSSVVSDEGCASVKSKISSYERETNRSRAVTGLQKSQSFAHDDIVSSRVTEGPKVSGFPGPETFSDGHSFEPRSRLVRMQTLVNLDGIETGVGNVATSGGDGDRFSPGKLQAKSLRPSSSFQVSRQLRETKIVSSFEKPKLSGTRSFCVRRNPSEFIENGQPRLGSVSTTKCYYGSISSSIDRESFESSIMDHRTANLSPPPLSNLQIFAISTKPLDIPVTNLDPVPGDVDKLPSLPIIQRGECKSESEKRLSILEPPPPGLVSREESTENWNRFLVQLNSILESRSGEFV